MTERVELLMQPRPHPIIPPPRLEAVAAALGAPRDDPAVVARFNEVVRRRAEVIAQETAEPLRYGWEPEVWRIADALQDLPLNPPGWRERTGLEWADWCERTRVAVGIESPLDLLLVSGANRASKTWWAAKRTVQLLLGLPEISAWCFHDSESRSRKEQQKYVYRMLPAIYRQKDVRKKRAYIGFKEHTGFSLNSFTLPNGSDCEFRFYAQPLQSHEGGNLYWIWPDELAGPELVETLLSRVATRGGRIALTFTPIYGWTATVQLIMQSAVTTRWERAYLLPKDGGEPDVARALGFPDEAAMREAQAEGINSLSPGCLDWWTAGPLTVPSVGDVPKPAETDGRQFEFMPRVMKCARKGWGVLFFHPMDNPYGNPLNVWKLWKGAGREKIERRLYGFPRRGFSAQFPHFDERVHVIPHEALPTRGPVVMMMDPTPGGRPFAMGWFRACHGKLYMIREWPDQADVIPGLGVLGPWAIPSGANNGKNDGAPGPGQEPIGWGLRQYLLEIARIEGWSAEDVTRVREWAPTPAPPEEPEPEADEFVDRPRPVRRLPPLIRMPAPEEVDLALGRGAAMRVLQRFMDCRAASAPRIERDRPRTLQTDFAEWGLDFDLAPGGRVTGRGDDDTDGVSRINDLLSFDRDAPMSAINSPRLYFSDRCKNTIFAMKNWQNAQKQSGACKDFVDLVRWAAVLECERLG